MDFMLDIYNVIWGCISIAMSDVTIFYQGGSGGFALYYYLLLSGRYQYNVETVNHMIAEQFPAELSSNPSKWKAREFWPNNVELKKSAGSRVFLICNPLFNTDMYDTNQMVSNDTYKILLYTDLKLQLRMAWDKQAYWFTDVSRRHFSAPAANTQYLRQILNSAVDSYDPEISQIQKTFRPNSTLRLEQFVLSQTVPFVSAPSVAQQDFLNYWLSLQTAKAQQLIKQFSLPEMS